MSGSHKDSALEAVARHVSATWKKDDGAILSRAGKRIAVEVAVVTPKIPDGAKPRLRFDKTALRLVRNLQEALSGLVPDGAVLVFTVTAPIRLASKTAAEMERRIREGLARGSAKFEFAGVVNDNHIRVRLVRDVCVRAAKVGGFVHNPDTDGRVLLDVAEALFRHIGAAAPAKPERWLVLAADDGFSHIETYRQVFVEMRIQSGFKKILMVFDGGRVETLTE